MFSTGPARGKAYARTLTGVESRVAALGAPGLDIVQHGVVMLLDKLDGVGADRQVKWRFLSAAISTSRRPRAFGSPCWAWLAVSVAARNAAFDAR